MRSAGGGRLREFAFTPVDTTDGAFQLWVQYLPSSAVTALEVVSSPQPLPEIIADYVGSPGNNRGSVQQQRSTLSASLHHGDSMDARHPGGSSAAMQGAHLSLQNNWQNPKLFGNSKPSESNVANMSTNCFYQM